MSGFGLCGKCPSVCQVVNAKPVWITASLAWFGQDSSALTYRPTVCPSHGPSKTAGERWSDAARTLIYCMFMASERDASR